VPRFVVVEGASPARATAGLALLGDRTPVPGWRGRGGDVCLGVVADGESAAAAVLAALRGADLAVELRAPRDVADRLLDDLRRVGSVTHVVDPHAEAAAAFGPEELRLLALLLSGCSLGAAARRMHLSRRTADRRVASIRAAFGATTTAEALRRAAEAGLTA
jgi:DNA-binding NarL/FixJ family response regulator